MGTTTTMSVAETSSSTVAPTSTLPDRTTTTGNPGEPQLVSGTKHREGTKISNELPEGAIGPSQHIIGEEEKLLQELTGASTYRLRSEVSGRFAMANSLVVDVAVIEGLHLSTGDSHAEWSVVDSTSGGLVPVTEEILVDGRRFRYAPADDEWEEFEYGSDLAGPVVMVPLAYSWIHEFSHQLGGAEWLGNEEIEGVAVGHYQWQRQGTIPGDGGETVWDAELWVDGRGVVWRFASASYIDGEPWQATDTVLYDVGAAVTIEAPPT